MMTKSLTEQLDEAERALAACSATIRLARDVDPDDRPQLHTRLSEAARHAGSAMRSLEGAAGPDMRGNWGVGGLTLPGQRRAGH